MPGDGRTFAEADADRRAEASLAAARLLAAETLLAADERSDKKIAAAVEGVMTNVTLHVGMAEKTLLQRIDGLKWRMIAALVGGQALAGLMAGLSTGRVPVPSVEAVSSLLPFL